MIATKFVLFLPLTMKKFKDEKIHPALTPIDCDVFECCASYIKEDFEDWDLKFVEVKPEIKKLLNKLLMIIVVNLMKKLIISYTIN